MKVIAIIPTYNEKENIGPMLDAWLKIAKENPKYKFEMLVIDDNSPDGTGKIATEYEKKHANIHLVSGPRQGYGKAIMKGYEYSMKELEADVVIPIDVDFQWDPFMTPKLLEKIDDGYDVVVPSRGVPGSSDDFTGFRKLTHWVSDTLLAYYWAGITEVKDHAGSFKAIRVKNHLDQVNIKSLDVVGFVIQMKTIYELSKTKAKFCELPAHYGERKAGTPTTVGMKSIKWFIKYISEYIKVATQIRFERSPWMPKFLKFGIVGGIGFVINVAGAFIFKKILIRPDSNLSLLNGVCNALAAEISIVSNFTWNNLWTFSKEKISNVGQLFTKFFTFNISSVITGIAIPSVVISLFTYFWGDRLFLYQVIAIFLLTIPLNWLIYNKVIWKKE
ncbi:MAG: glycosyltransferase [Patescibacteria group bacterium]|nr:glycosyltransferase [Patescibacteria group bacterium]